MKSGPSSATISSIAVRSSLAIALVAATAAVLAAGCGGEEDPELAPLLGEEHEVDVQTGVVRARSIGHAIVEEAQAREVDLVVLGSSAHWRRQSRFFSPTVDFVLRHAPCEVLVVAFPEGVFES